MIISVLDNQVASTSNQGSESVPSTSHGLFRPWDFKGNPASGLNLLAEAVDLRISNNRDIEMFGVGNNALPFMGQPPIVPQLMDVGDDPVLISNDAEMATEDDFDHIFSDISDIELDDPNSEVQDGIFEIDNFISEFEYPDTFHSQYRQE